jgi:hypothetical protein
MLTTLPPAPVEELPPAPVISLPAPPAPVDVPEEEVPPSFLVDFAGVSLALHPASAIAKRLELVKPRIAMCRVFMMLWPF